LLRLLRGLDQQIFTAVAQPSICLIVVDNSAEADAAEFCRTHQSVWPIHYRHEPRPGISHARNTAVAAVPEGTDFIAMIDDDEVPSPNWLDQLLHTQALTSADVVVGPTTPVFPEGTPEWVSASGFFIKPRKALTLKDLAPKPPAATCNVLVRANLLGSSGYWFDPALTFSGGEDTLLFQSLKQSGCRFIWAAQAHVSEWIPAERANLRYMWREAYRRGSVKYYVKLHRKAHTTVRAIRIKLRLLLRALIRIGVDSLYTLANIWRGRAIWLPHAFNVADSLGIIAGVFHIPNRHYRNEKSA
tara:strand:+ start:340 stop:1242 length:903 start_codon:yes stop_codon:yes gene_type:complete